MSKWLNFRVPTASSSTHTRSSSADSAEAFRRLFHPSNPSSTTENGNDSRGGRQRDNSEPERSHADRGYRSMDASSLFPFDEWEVLDDEGNPVHTGNDGQLFSPGVVDSSAGSARHVIEACAGMEQTDRTTSKWGDAGNTHSFLVRGPTYLRDKIKQPAGTAMCRLVGVDCFAESAPGVTRIDHIASRIRSRETGSAVPSHASLLISILRLNLVLTFGIPPEFRGSVHLLIPPTTIGGSCREQVQKLTSGADPPFLFIMNIQVGGTPMVSLVVYWAIDRRALNGAAGGGEDFAGRPNGHDTEGQEERSVSQEQGFAGIFARYANIPLSSFGGEACSLMDAAPPRPPTDERNQRFKLIPRVISGSWMMRKAIGSTPVLLGTKIHHRHYRGEHYIETDLDTGSSMAAAALCTRCRWFSRNIDVELGIVLQANAPQELPEALLGAVRLNGFGVEDPNLQRKLFT